jgi:hypothetical protein
MPRDSAYALQLPLFVWDTSGYPDAFALKGVGDTRGSPVLHRHTAGVREQARELVIRFHMSAQTRD